MVGYGLEMKLLSDAANYLNTQALYYSEIR
jgi:hypothetical protein